MASTNFTASTSQAMSSSQSSLNQLSTSMDQTLTTPRTSLTTNRPTTSASTSVATATTSLSLFWSTTGIQVMTSTRQPTTAALTSNVTQTTRSSQSSTPLPFSSSVPGATVSGTTSTSEATSITTIPFLNDVSSTAVLSGAATPTRTKLEPLSLQTTRSLISTASYSDEEVLVISDMSASRTSSPDAVLETESAEEPLTSYFSISWPPVSSTSSTVNGTLSVRVGAGNLFLSYANRNILLVTFTFGSFFWLLVSIILSIIVRRWTRRHRVNYYM